MAATVTSEAGEVAYDHKAVVQLLNVAGTPLGWAIIGGFVGLTVWFVGRLTGRPGKRAGKSSQPFEGKTDGRVLEVEGRNRKRGARSLRREGAKQRRS